MTYNVEADVISIISGIAHPRRPVDRSTSINLELPIDGDDAHELLEAIPGRFKTNFDDFLWHRYFNDELPWLSKLELLPYKEMRSNLTVGRLIDAVLKERWTET